MNKQEIIQHLLDIISDAEQGRDDSPYSGEGVAAVYRVGIMWLIEQLKEKQL